MALLLFTLAAGAFDYGQGWRSGLAVNEASRTGARVGSAGGKNRAADFNALSGLKASLKSSDQLSGVQRVVVFNATLGDGNVPEPCKTNPNPPAGLGCQVIPGVPFRDTNWEAGSVAAQTQTDGCLTIATGRSWCPTSRDNNQASLDYYGVWIQVRHDYLFPVVGKHVYIERTAVMRLEPKVI